MMASRSPSSAISAPVDVLIVRMLHPKAPDGTGFVAVELDEILRARQRQHRLDALLHAGELQAPSGAADLPVQIHQTADGRAVDVGHRRQIDEDGLTTRGNQGRYGLGEVAQHRIHQARLSDADDRDGAGLFGPHVHYRAPVRERASLDTLLGLNPSPRSRRIWRASSVRPRLMRDFTVPSGSLKRSAIS